MTLSPSPDLKVTQLSAPVLAREGDTIDLAWEVRNDGDADATGSWTDTVVLMPLDPAKAPVVVGSFTNDRTLGAGQFYQRAERFRLPTFLEGAWRLQVTTNANGGVFEAGDAARNNTLGDDTVLEVQLNPRPNLRVQAIEVPPTATAGGTISATFQITNAGLVATPPVTWRDNVYLSLDNRISSDDILIGSFENQAGLEPGAAYSTITTPLQIPFRLSGDAYIIVSADGFSQVDEYPFDRDNILARKITVDPVPKADLVLAEVVAPTQSVYGAEIEVRYRVTNRGSNTTFEGAWQDTIWITRDKRRPNTLPAPGPDEQIDFNKGNSAILLGTVSRSGRLEVGESYEQVARVRLPADIASGTYYITPWTDSLDLVTEDTLAVNINPDDPNEFDNNNYKARRIEVIGYTPRLPDLVVSSVQASDRTEAGRTPLVVSWEVQNRGIGNADASNVWNDIVFLSDQADPESRTAKTWFLGEFQRSGGLGISQSYSATQSFDLAPPMAGLYIHVKTGQQVPGYAALAESSTTNNAGLQRATVVDTPADLVVSDVSATTQNFSGESTTISWTVTNTGVNPVWDGTSVWYDSVFISPDETFISGREILLGRVLRSNATPLAPGQSYSVSKDFVLPRGIDGRYYIYVVTDGGSAGEALAQDTQGGRLDATYERYRSRVYEGSVHANNIAQGPIDVVYREPNLTVTDITLPATTPQSGDTIAVAFTVENIGTRATRETTWLDRVYLSRDGSLDSGDVMLGQIARIRPLDAGDSYRQTINVQLPEGISGGFHIIVMTDSSVEPFYEPSSIDPALFGLRVRADRVPEFRDEGDNVRARPLDVLLRTPPNLRVTSVQAPERLLAGSSFTASWTVTNTGAGAVPDTQASWFDDVFLSRDPVLDASRDIYLGRFAHDARVGLAAGQGYTRTERFTLPSGLTGAYYLLVSTDPKNGSRSPRGAVYEAREEDNTGTSTAPILLELPPPADLVVSDVSVSGGTTSGDLARITWTVTNVADNPASGTWSDAVYLSTDPIWGLDDIYVGRVTQDRILAKNQAYTATLEARLPPLKEGSYRFIVRADIKNQIYEAEGEANNTIASANSLYLSVEEIPLGVAKELTLAPGETRLFKVATPLGHTMRVTLDDSDGQATNELFLRWNDVPTGTAFDAVYDGPLQADQVAMIPSTKPGEYYVLVRGVTRADPTARLTLTPQLVPLEITSVTKDQGGDGRWVTVTITGADFSEDATLKLSRPGIAEFAPTRMQVIDATKIVAIFDLTGAPLGLYDVIVTNPDGAKAIEPYRYLVERAVEQEVTVGLGGPRVVPVGSAGTYAVTLQSLTNVDTPYVRYTFGIPYIGTNPKAYDIPYVEFSSNLTGTPDGTLDPAVPWASLRSEVNTSGYNLAPGYAFDLGPAATRLSPSPPRPIRSSGRWRTAISSSCASSSTSRTRPGAPGGCSIPGSPRCRPSLPRSTRSSPIRRNR